MKDGWIVVLVLLIIAFVVSSWFLINRVGERSVTGNLADNDGELRNEIVNKNSENNTDNEEILSFDFRCEVESPFFCRIWSFDKEGTFIGRFDLRFKPEKGGPQQSSAGIIDEELIN